MVEAAASTTNGWLPAVTALAGVLLGQLGEWLRARRANEKEQAIRVETRREAAEQHAKDFQLENLLSLQDWTFKLYRATMDVYIYNSESEKNFGAWRGRVYPLELDEPIRLASIQTSMLSVRVQDEEIRKLSEVLKNSHVDLIHTHTRQQGEDVLERMTSEFQLWNVAVGNRIRSIYPAL